MYFKPGDSDSEQMRRPDKRKSTVMAGLSYVHNTPYGFLRTTIAGDTLDNSNGINWDLARLYRYTNGNLTLTPGIGVEWNSDNQNEYYYGVSQHESRRSGMRSYDPDSSWNPYLELAANYRFLGDWSVYGIARYTRLSDEITDSPMVDKSSERSDLNRDHLHLLIVHYYSALYASKQGFVPCFALWWCRARRRRRW